MFNKKMLLIYVLDCDIDLLLDCDIDLLLL